MTFLNPLLLAGLVAVAIPVIVHLFHFRRPQRLDLPTLRFLRAVEATAVRRLRLRQWLLLALRVAAVAALALAFARPTRTATADGVFSDTGARSLAVVVDNSRSMTLRDAEGPLFAQAKRLAEGAIGATGPGDERTLIPTAAQVGVRPVPYTAAGPALDALAALQPAAGADVLTAAVARAGSVLEGAVHPRREVVVVSDLQASTFTDSVRADLPADVGLVLLPLSARARVNTAVTAVRVASAIVEPGRPVRIEATVQRFGGRAGSVAASLTLDGARVAEASVEVTPGRPSTVVFSATPRTRGWVGGEVRIEPDAEEAEWDDVRFLALHVPPPPRVLVVRGDGARSDLVALALGVVSERGGMAVTEIAEGALGGADLGRADVVVLVGPTSVSPAAAASLGRFVAGGGGVLAFPGDPVDALNPALAALGGGRITGAVGALGGPSVGGLASTDLDHPLFSGVFDTAVPTVESPDVRRAARYVPGRGDEQTLMQLAAGPPLLHEVRHGSGRTLLVGVAPDPAWSDLPERGLFVPLLVRSVAYLAAGSSVGEGAAPDGGQAVRVEGAQAGEGVRLLGPEGQVVPAAQRAVGGAVLVSLAGASGTAGVYRVVQGERVLRTVAVNEDARESDPTPLAPAEAARRLEEATGRPVRLVDARDGAGLAAVEGRSSGAPLWTWFLALALTALVAETAVVARWRREAA
ncbi:MAG TPA: BatA and WFA domain-containing protein [Rubricoccaceae bacterium]|jgi:hypothetical protein